MRKTELAICVSIGVFLGSSIIFCFLSIAHARNINAVIDNGWMTFISGIMVFIISGLAINALDKKAKRRRNARKSLYVGGACINVHC